MGANLRYGKYGPYWGTTFDESVGLVQTQMNINAVYIYSYLKDKGWTLNAIAGILGNIQAESNMNPGRWQSEDVGNTSMGYGLCQWTPASKYIDWCGSKDPSEMDNNLDRIIYELDNGLQYYATDDYPETFREFTKSTKSPSYLAVAFLKNYERAGVEVIETRKANADSWYSFLGGVEPSNPGGSSKKKKKKFNFILFNRKRGRVYG